MAIGHYCSSSSIPASDAYLDGGVLQITPASTNPLFTDRGMWNVFRTCGRDDQQGGFAGSYLAKHFKGKNIAILNDKTTYGKGLADEMKKALNTAGVKEKMDESYTQGDKDFTALVSKLKANAIDVVYVGGYHTEAGLILRQMRDAGAEDQMISGDALATNEFSSITGPAGEGMMFTFGPDPRKRPTAAAVVKGSRTRASIRRATRSTPTPRSRSGPPPPTRPRRSTPRRSRQTIHARHLGYGARPDLLRREGRHHHH